jgi:N6-L-threonylcarbamoyladenine synthase
MGNEFHSVATTSPRKLLLAIESSCDETAAAIIDDRLNILSSVVASQDALHQRFGGVVPEIASRAHVSQVLPVIDEALRRARASLADLEAIAVMTQPGLVGSLLVGVTAAKTLALVLDKPLLAVNHIHAHLYACRMMAEREIFPAIGLVVSGGHTNLYHCRGATDFELIGSTIDDAAGEAFDKAASLLGLPYPGGPSMQRAAQGGNPEAFHFPRSFLREERLAFSFSGLKTALRYTALGQPGSSQPPPALTSERIADLAASYQEAIVDVLIGKSQQALQRYRLNTLCIGGGVAANARFRERLIDLEQRIGLQVLIAPPALCTDNAAMGGLAWELYRAGDFSPLDVDVVPGLVRHTET